ncbi:MAG: hypothetical protein HW380_3834 [Magnetococcales bacterium]|nr:hypothetical protein [Magnetococcales bacterium]HIJ83571.1 HlyD family efflux transporter periplasmic adaptor subunit [Magnetococcales bacterium]
MSETVDKRQLAGATNLLLLEQDARRSQTIDELVFLMVNRSATVLLADILFFFPLEKNRMGRLTAVSGVSELDRQAPMVVWLNTFMGRQPLDPRPRILANVMTVEDLEGWGQWLPAAGMICPLTTPWDGVVGFLLLARSRPWLGEELDLAARLGMCYGHALESLTLKRSTGWRGEGWNRTRGLLLGIGLVLVCMAWPVRQSVLAPAKVVAEEPRLVTAPMDGVVATIAVEPNSLVHAGQELLTMERSLLANRQAMAVEALRMAETEVLRAQQLAFSREDIKANLPMLRSRIDERTVELQHAQGTLERSRVLSPGDGLAIFASHEEWLGQPVRVGQRIMVIADPDKVAVTMDLSIHDAVTLNPGGEFLLFLDTDPLHPRSGRVVRSSYEAATTPEGMVAFSVRGQLVDSSPPPRIGLRGSARLFGERTSLFFFLFRRPLSVLRQFVGI